MVTDAGGLARLGLSICYDLRFPGLYAKLCGPAEFEVDVQPKDSVEDVTEANESGGFGGNAEIVLVPSAFTVTTGRAHWEVLLRARAIENQVYVVAAAQSGKHHSDSHDHDGRVSYGHSMVVDPWGTVLAECTEEGEGVCYAEFDRDSWEKTRSNMPVWVSLNCVLLKIIEDN